MHLLVSIAVFGFAFFVTLGALHFVGELLALSNRRPPSLFGASHDDGKDC
jgi:hypothetical protein